MDEHAIMTTLYVMAHEIETLRYYRDQLREENFTLREMLAELQKKEEMKNGDGNRSDG